MRAASNATRFSAKLHAMHVQDAPIGDPCGASSDVFTPNAKGDYCHRCRKQVHDLSAMTAEAAVAFVELNRERDVCVSYWVNGNGHLEHAAPQPRSLVRPRPVHALAVATLAAACNTQPAAKERADEVPAAQTSALETEDAASTDCASNTAPASSAPLPATTAAEQTVNPPTVDPIGRVMGKMRSRNKCDPAWYLGADGVRRPRPECLR